MPSGTLIFIQMGMHWKVWRENLLESLLTNIFNYSLAPLPPGCLSIDCAHGRAPEFYAESVYPGNENNFLAVKCGSLSALIANFCPGRKEPMGYAASPKLKGNFFLKTKDKSPYGENAPSNFTPVCNWGFNQILIRKLNLFFITKPYRNSFEHNLWILTLDIMNFDMYAFYFGRF